MGFFSSPKKFSSRNDIKEALYNVHSLSFEERQKVFDALEQELDGGGVTSEEFKKTIKRLRFEHKISEIDRDNLLKLL
ncbi:hypothetical protein C4569_00665 [Candidatus Parcubacteria bacterium]|nr:MAG: hypothetical protein C4569_00665 [Candidatus Parcubacteria bacterium]